MKKTVWLPVVAATGLLGGCGGGGGAGSGPQPAPPPPPPPSNTSLDDLKYNQTFAALQSSSALALDYSTGGTIRGTATAGSITVRYDAAANSYTITAPGRSQTFAPADIQDTEAGFTTYEKDDGTTFDALALMRIPYNGSLGNRYVGMGYWIRDSQDDSQFNLLFDSFVYGFETPNAAVPRTGSAGFGVMVYGMATKPGLGPQVFTGLGTFNADFLTGTFDTQTYIEEYDIITGSGHQGGSMELRGSGRLSSTDNSFAGNVIYHGFHNSVAGNMTGRLYGPDAQELGAVFAGSDAQGNTINGALIGWRDPSKPAVNLALTNIIAPQSFDGENAGLRIYQFEQNGSFHSSTSFFPNGIRFEENGSLVLHSGHSTIIPDISFSEASIVQSKNPNFTTYESTVDGAPVRLELYKQGRSNTELQLTYSSFGRWSATSRSDQATIVDHQFFAFGIPTIEGVLDARTGSARYTGVAYGAGVNDTTKAAYDVTGTSRFDVNFSDRSFSGALALRGTPSAGGTAVDFGSYDFNGSLGARTSHFTADMTAASAEKTGELKARFYGPTGEEIAGQFRLIVPEGRAGAGTHIAGATAATRQ